VHQEARLPWRHPSEPLGGSPLLALQLLVLPHGPADPHPVQAPAGRSPRRLGGLPSIRYPSAQAGLAPGREVVARVVTTPGQPPAPERLPPRSGRPGTERWGEVEQGLPPAMLRPSWTPRRAQQGQAGVRPGTPAIGLLAVHAGCLVRMPCPVARGQPGRAARWEPACWRCTLAMRDASSGLALAGAGRRCPRPPGLARVMPEELGADGADTAPCGPPGPRGTRAPSWPCPGACHPRATSRRPHGQAVGWRSARHHRVCSLGSQHPLRSRARPQA
jgi:hypothetical protein